MANNCVALLLVVCLVVVAGVAEARFATAPALAPDTLIHTQATTAECYDYCYRSFLLPDVIAKWICSHRCKYPIFFDGPPGEPIKQGVKVRT